MRIKSKGVRHNQRSVINYFIVLYHYIVPRWKRSDMMVQGTIKDVWVNNCGFKCWTVKLKVEDLPWTNCKCKWRTETPWGCTNKYLRDINMHRGLCEICNGTKIKIHNMESQQWDKEVIIAHSYDFNVATELEKAWNNKRMEFHARGTCLWRVDGDSGYIKPSATLEQNSEPPLNCGGSVIIFEWEKSSECVHMSSMFQG